MSVGMTCPKCGLMQLAAPTCKACGAATGRQALGHLLPPIEPLRPAAGVKEEPETAAPPPDAGGGAVRQEFFFYGAGGSLFGIFLVNTLLTLLTLGVYHFWAKVRIRRYLMSQAEFEGDRFAYHGTGAELFFGFLKAALVFWLPVFVLNIGMTLMLRTRGRAIAGFLTWALAMIFLPVAIAGARRYRLSRTSWRGIRFAFKGGTLAFARLFLTGSLLTALTLGIYYPAFLVSRYGFLTAHSYFGTLKAGFDGRGRDLLGSFLLALVLTPFTLGLIWIWFAAKKHRYLWGRTTLGKARFEYDVTFGRLFGLYFVNGLLLICTLGLAWPWVAVRNARFALQYLSLQGGVDLGAIQQDVQAASATGDALSGFLDAGFDLG